MTYQECFTKSDGAVLTCFLINHISCIQSPLDNHATIDLEAQVGTISTKLDQRKEKDEKETMIVDAYATIDPKAMMIESSNACFAHGAMLGTCRSISSTGSISQSLVMTISNLLLKSTCGTLLWLIK